jgi:hypothetical protein
VKRALVVLFSFFLLQETNLGSLIVGAECLEQCADDVAPGHCSPACATCACGTHANPVSPKVTRLSAPAASTSRGFTEAASVVGDLHLPDILHVPKLFVA